MLLIHCPYCGEDRPELEFRYAGEAHVARSQNIAEISGEDFERFFFIRSNPRGTAFERWRHVHGCGRFFNAVRDTVSDRFVTTYKAGEPRPVLPGAPAPGPAMHANVEPKKVNAATPAKKRAAKGTKQS